MGDFQHCIELILAEEGGLAHYRRDPGRLTKYGISQRSYPELNIAAPTARDRHCDLPPRLLTDPRRRLSRRRGPAPAGLRLSSL